MTSNEEVSDLRDCLGRLKQAAQEDNWCEFSGYSSRLVWQEIERLRALIKKAGDLLTYGGPDMVLQADDGSDWIDKCDEWFKAADYGMPKPRPAVETKDEQG